MESRPGWHRVVLDPAGRGLVQTGRGAIAVFVVDGQPYAVANACPHAGNPLVHGQLAGRTLVCAYHGWRFDLATGACLHGEEPVRTFEVERRDGQVWLMADPD